MASLELSGSRGGSAPQTRQPARATNLRAFLSNADGRTIEFTKKERDAASADASQAALLSTEEQTSPDYYVLTEQDLQNVDLGTEAKINTATLKNFGASANNIVNQLRHYVSSEPSAQTAVVAH